MKALALNASAGPFGQSKTALVLLHLVQRMTGTGAVVEVVNPREKKVNDCIGCYTCWTKTPGVCIHRDDMTQELFPKWMAADIVIHASPLYHFTVNAAMKRLIERTMPALKPYLTSMRGRRTHFGGRGRRFFPDDGFREKLTGESS